MGSICGPTIANLRVYIDERIWCSIHRPICYKRFIDDLFLIVSSLSVLESLERAFGNLKLNLVIDKRQVFLDLEIELNPLTQRLNFYAHFKPTNTFAYLKVLSNHPPHIFKNIIKALFIRLRRNCTYLSDYLFFASFISLKLKNRGYDEKLIKKSLTMVSNLDQESLIEYKNKDKGINFDKTFIFRQFFDKNIVNFNKVLKDAFNNFKDKVPIFKDHRIFLVNKMQNNLASIMIHGFSYPSVYKNNFKRCKNKTCRTCLYSNNRECFYLTEEFSLPIFDNSNCYSKDLVYILYCSFCFCFYIGQTNCLKDRIYNHIRDIKKFDLNFISPNQEFKCVSTHFNKKNHNLNEHFSFFVIKTNIEKLEERLNIESFFLNLCVSLGLREKLINDFIPQIKNYDKL